MIENFASQTEIQNDEFRDILLRHARHPLRVGDVSIFGHRGSCKNPLCGDAVDVGVDLVDGRISKIRIQASGCGISTASASLMTDVVEGLTIEAALAKLEIFKSVLTEAPRSWPGELFALQPFSRLRESPTRVPCALIGWFALKDAVKSL